MEETEKGKLPSEDKVWWRPAAGLFSEVSSWIFVPIILALLLGKYLDGRWGTEPTMLLVSVGVGFIVSSYGITKAVKNYMDKISKDSTNGDTKTQ